MPNNLYKVIAGGTLTPLATDLNQYADALTGANDIGQITLAAQITAPSTTGVTATAAAGSGLGIGAYSYKFTYVVGYKKSDNTIIYGNETNGSASVTVTTTSGNQKVNLAGLPTAWPATAVAMRIYRTAVGGADGTQKLVATITTPSATYADTTADASLGAAVPTTNTTGTVLSESFPLGQGSRAMIPNYNQYASIVGNSNIYTTVQLKRPDGTLYLQSVLSSPDANGNYQTDTWTFYAADGTTVTATHVWALTWDNNAKITSKVMTS